MTRVVFYTPSAYGGHAAYTKEVLTELHAMRDGSISFELVTSHDLYPSFADVPYLIHRILPPLKPKDAYPSKLHWVLARIRHYTRRERLFYEWLLAQRDISIIHLQEFAPWLLKRYADKARRIGIHVVYSVHNIRPHVYPRLVPPKLYDFFIRSGLSRCSALFVHTIGLKRDLLAFLKSYNDSCVHVAEHGCWSGGESIMLPSPEERFVKRTVLFFGNIRQNKGLHYLIDAMKQLQDVRLIVAGYPEDERYVQERIRPQMASIKNATFDLSFVPEERMAEYFLQSSVLVLPYKNFFAQSGVLFLAVKYGLPVIVTDEGGVAGTVLDHGIGEVVTAGDTMDLYRAIQGLFSRYDRYCQYALATLKFKATSSWENMASSFIHVYRSLI